MKIVKLDGVNHPVSYTIQQIRWADTSIIGFPISVSDFALGNHGTNENRPRVAFDIARPSANEFRWGILL